MKKSAYLAAASITLFGALIVSKAYAKELPPEVYEKRKTKQVASQVEAPELTYSIEGIVAVADDETPAPAHDGAAPPADDKKPARTPEEQILIDQLESVSPAKPDAKPADKIPPRPGVQNQGSTKNRQIKYDSDTDSFRTHVEGNEWQKAYPDRRGFAVFARNYVNRIHCEGGIADVIFPQEKGVELELKNRGRDLFLQVGPTVPPEFTHFPFDVNIICDGEVFQVNGIIDAKYPATNLELVLSGSVRPESLKPYESAIFKAQALPHEEKIAKIMRRVWNGNFLPYWRVSELNSQCGLPGNCTLRKSVETGIDGLVAWDFVVPLNLDIPQMLARLNEHVKGDILGIGRVPLRSSQRVIILTIKAGGK